MPTVEKSYTRTKWSTSAARFSMVVKHLSVHDLNGLHNPKLKVLGIIKPSAFLGDFITLIKYLGIYPY